MTFESSHDAPPSGDAEKAPVSRIEHLTADNFEAKLAENHVALIDFWASWCPPCRAMNPILEKLSQRLPDVFFGKVNVDEEEELAKGLNIKSLPTFALFINDQRVADSMGAKPLDAMVSWIESHIPPKPVSE